MDTTAHPSDTESYSGRPWGSQDARRSRGNPDPTWGEGENKTAQRRRLYPKVRSYTILAPVRIDNGWYRGEDLMDPREVASPVCRVGRPNVDGSVGGDQANPLPPQRPGRQYSHYDKELRWQITYPRSEKVERGKYPHITEEERLERAERQDTDLRHDAYWKD